ncbi:hypothetical protein [Sorangium sp. So ce1389]|uniref:hypothetical protein n=1 Tax=Sorangium sp. So ce1389 TaxID=3133336 RepID=UPI003F5FD136
MKKRGRLSGEQGEACLLIAESGAPWTLRELLGGGAVTVSLEGTRGEPLRRLAHLAAV